MCDLVDFVFGSQNILYTSDALSCLSLSLILSLSHIFFLSLIDTGCTEAVQHEGV